MCQNFVHLHVHSDASPDGMSPVDMLVSHAKALNFDALALTDHQTLANSIAHAVACENAGIKPITGVEGYILHNNEIRHITLLADGNIGWKNLVILNNIAHTRHELRRPAFTIEELFEHNEGIVVLSGCIASIFHNSPYPEALSIGREFKRVFGDRFFAEVMAVTHDSEHHELPERLAYDLSIDMIYTNDVHYPKREWQKIHADYCKIRAGYSYDSEQLFLRTRQEIERIYNRHDALDNAYKHSQKIQPVNFKRASALPNIKDSDDVLRGIVTQWLDKNYPHAGADRQRYSDRIDEELTVIGQRAYSPYFLVLRDILSFAEEKGIKVGAGRGSAAGSLVLFATGATQVDPMEYDLSFERFLNPKRKGEPDVDTDFCAVRRHEVIEYAKETWGAVGIMTYGTYQHASLVHELCKYLHIPKDIEEGICNEGEHGLYFGKACQIDNRFGLMYEAMHMQIRNKGQHAGGIVILPEGLIAPIEQTSDKKQLAVAWQESASNKTLSIAGGVKFDLLGLSSATFLDKLEHTTGVKAPHPRDIKPNDPVWKLFADGNTLGIFQFSGKVPRDLAMKIKPTSVQDLSDISALARPGALMSGIADKYHLLRGNPRLFGHPEVDDILAPTRGVILYQETVMRLFAYFLYENDLGDGDNARRLITNSKPDDMQWQLKVAELKEEWIVGCANKGVSRQVSLDVWNDIQEHSGYSFNYSHSLSYSFMTLALAWFKQHYPAQYYAAALNTQETSDEASFLFEASRFKIEIKPPDIQDVSTEWYVKNGVLHAPLTAVKFLSQNAAQEIISKSPFTSILDFATRVEKRKVNARVKKAMWLTGCFDTFIMFGDEYKELDLTPKDLSAEPQRGSFKARQAYMSAILPNPEVLAWIENTQPNQISGIVVNRKKKNSEKGNFSWYTLSPSGATFWVRDAKVTFSEGQVIRVTLDKRNMFYSVVVL